MGAKVIRRMVIAKPVDEVIRDLMLEGWKPVSVRADGATFNRFKANGNLDARVSKASDN